MTICQEPRYVCCTAVLWSDPVIYLQVSYACKGPSVWTCLMTTNVTALLDMEEGNVRNWLAPVRTHRVVVMGECLVEYE